MSRPANNQHFSSREMYRYFLGEMEPDEAAHLEAHLGGCDRCVHRARGVHVAAGAPMPPPVDPFADDPLPHAELTRWWLRPWIVLPVAAALLLVAYLAFSGLKKALPPIVAVRPVNNNTGTTLRDGNGTLTFSPAGDVSEPSLSLTSEWREQFRQLLVARQVTQPHNIVLAMERMHAAEPPRGAEQCGNASSAREPIPLQPCATAVKTTQPEFAWTPVAGAESYTIRVKNGADTVVAEMKLGNAVGWRPAASLHPGEVYSWQVEAITSGGEEHYSDWETFAVPDAGTLTAVSALRTEFAQSPFALAAMYETYGMYRDADEQLHRLAELNPRATQPPAMLAALDKLRFARKTPGQGRK
jgi:hypothetical protein